MVYHEITDPLYRRLPRYLFVEDLIAGKKVLEIGCGTGTSAEFLAGMGVDRVLGVEQSEEGFDPAEVMTSGKKPEWNVTREW